MAKKKESNIWKAVKVGRSEKHFTTTHVSRFRIFKKKNVLAMKFTTHIINIEMML